MTGIQREVSKVAWTISKTTNITVKILSEINQEMDTELKKNSFMK